MANKANMADQNGKRPADSNPTEYRLPTKAMKAIDHPLTEMRELPRTIQVICSGEPFWEHSYPMWWLGDCFHGPLAQGKTKFVLEDVDADTWRQIRRIGMLKASKESARQVILGDAKGFEDRLKLGHKLHRWFDFMLNKKCAQEIQGIIKEIIVDHLKKNCYKSYPNKKWLTCIAELPGKYLIHVLFVGNVIH
jgi:hypothetical protein